MTKPAINDIQQTATPKYQGRLIELVKLYTRVVTNEFNESNRNGRLRATDITISKSALLQ